jgi:hypothetical protein
MTALLVVLAAWFALAIPVALFLGRLIRVGPTDTPRTVPTADDPVAAIADPQPRPTVGRVAVQR